MECFIIKTTLNKDTEALSVGSSQFSGLISADHSGDRGYTEELLVIQPGGLGAPPGKAVGDWSLERDIGQQTERERTRQRAEPCLRAPGR